MPAAIAKRGEVRPLRRGRSARVLSERGRGKTGVLIRGSFMMAKGVNIVNMRDKRDIHFSEFVPTSQEAALSEHRSTGSGSGFAVWPAPHLFCWPLPQQAGTVVPARRPAMVPPANQILRHVGPRAAIRRSISCVHGRPLVATAAGATAEPEGPAPANTEGKQKDGNSNKEKDDKIYLKGPSSGGGSSCTTRDQTSVTMPMSFMTGSIIGKRFYNEVNTRMADDGNGWTVMLDYRTLKTPSKRPLKIPSLALAKAIAAEWEYQEEDGIRPFTMPLMKLACTAMERVPLTRAKIIEHLIKKFHQDLVFCRSPGDSDLTSGVLERQVEKLDPILDWLESEFGFKPVVYSSFFGGKQEDGLVNAIESALKKTTDCELAAIDAIAAAAHSLIIPLGLVRGRLEIEEAIKLIRLEEDLQVDRWGLVEGGHDVDIADLQVQISSAAVFLGLSQRQ